MQGAQAGLDFAARSSNKLNPFGLSWSSPGQPVEGTLARKAGNTVAASVPHPSTVAPGPNPQIPERKNPQPRPQWIVVRGVGSGTGVDRKAKMTLCLGWVIKLLVPAGSVCAQTCSLAERTHLAFLTWLALNVPSPERQALSADAEVLEGRNIVQHRAWL